jgi:hypothetical protein
LKNVKKNRKWRNILCDFGESCASWYLEDKKNIYLVKLRWIDFPFKILPGIDLVGIAFSSEELCCAEAKTLNSTNISSTIKGISNELKNDRIHNLLNSPINDYGSKAWLIEKLVDAGKLPIEKVKEIFEKNQYTRYGFIFHPRRKKPAPYDVAKKLLEDEDQPVFLFDYELEDLEFEIVSFVEVVAIPRGVI